jgi:hypothetical protein
VVCFLGSCMAASEIIGNASAAQITAFIRCFLDSVLSRPDWSLSLLNLVARLAQKASKELTTSLSRTLPAMVSCIDFCHRSWFVR